MASYGGFLRRYVAAVAMVVSIEEGGAPYVEVSLRGGRLALRANIEHAALVPRQGPPRPLPDRCQVRFSFTMKQGLFRVGFERLSGELALLRVPPLGFDVRFRTEPDWQLPFLVAPFLSGPLRRPFEGEGVTLSYRLEDSAPGAGSATATRDYRLAVKENWIVRWLAGNVGGTVVDFRRGAEPEADRFASEALLALHDDVLALLADARPQ